MKKSFVAYVLKTDLGRGSKRVEILVDREVPFNTFISGIINYFGLNYFAPKKKTKERIFNMIKDRFTGRNKDYSDKYYIVFDIMRDKSFNYNSFNFKFYEANTIVYPTQDLIDKYDWIDKNFDIIEIEELSA